MTEIFFLINSLENSGGTERVSTLLANTLSKSGIKITFCTLLDFEMPFFELDKNISLIKLSSQHGLYKKRDYIKYIRRLRMLMKNISQLI